MRVTTMAELGSLIREERLRLEDVARAAGPAVAGALGCLRRGEADCRPGYDGCYGAVSFPTPEG